jgi:acyl-CoA synthetase (AMP-forming)/AMP-acid ligase II
MRPVQTLPELLARYALAADRPFLTFVDLTGVETRRSTHELYRASTAAAASLHEQGVRPRDRLLLLLPNGVPFVETLLGILLVGAVPVIYPPPYLARALPRYLAQLQRILQQCQPWGAVLDAQAMEVARGLSVPGIRLIPPPAASGAAAFDGPHRADPEEVALVQYSSGSTGDPKGVLLSHRAICSNARATRVATGDRADEVFLSWAPVCHDMGLFGGVLFPWFHDGAQSVLMTPYHFVLDPASWLHAASRFRATISTGPNFAFHLCLGLQDRQLEGVDLASLRIVSNGAEPISRSIVERFIDRFRAYGLRPEVMACVYGMAENTVAVTFPRLDRPPRFDRILRQPLEEQGRAVPAPQSEPEVHVKDIAGLGSPVLGAELQIVDEKGAVQPERVEGEICIRGTSLMSGYLNHPQATAEALRDGWFHTTDLGYVANGELFVTGRRGDLLIRAGRNLHPQDLEATAERVPGTRHGRVAVLAYRDAAESTDQIAVLAETDQHERTELVEIACRIRRALLEDFGLPPDRVVLLAPQVLPKTTSGKLQRRLAGRLLQRGDLPVLLSWPA